MSVYAHLFVDNRIRAKQRLAHAPRVGDTVRLPGEQYARITEIVWCLDEKDALGGDRINVRCVDASDDDTPE